MTMSTLYPISRLAKTIVEEKEIRMRELLKISGVKDWVHHLSWTINGFVLFFWIALTSSYIAGSSFLPSSNSFLLFMFFFLFCMSEITLAFLISVFFNNSKLAAIAAPVVLFFTILPRFAFVGTNENEAVQEKYLASLLSPTAFSLGAGIIADYEFANIGIQFDNISQGDFNMASVYLMLTADIFIYALLAWYFDLVLPQEYGTSRHFLFFLMPSYWSSCCDSCLQCFHEELSVNDYLGLGAATATATATAAAPAATAVTNSIQQQQNIDIDMYEHLPAELKGLAFIC